MPTLRIKESRGFQTISLGEVVVSRIRDSAVKGSARDVAITIAHQMNWKIEYA